MKKLIIILVAILAVSCTKEPLQKGTVPQTKSASQFSVAGIWNLSKDYPVPYESPVIEITNKVISCDTIAHLVTYGFTANNPDGLKECTAIFTKNGGYLDIKHFDLQAGKYDYKNKTFALMKVDKTAKYSVMLYIN